MKERPIESSEAFWVLWDSLSSGQRAEFLGNLTQFWTGETVQQGHILAEMTSANMAKRDKELVIRACLESLEKRDNRDGTDNKDRFLARLVSFFAGLGGKKTTL